jgi:hypothetical protein
LLPARGRAHNQAMARTPPGGRGRGFGAGRGTPPGGALGNAIGGTLGTLLRTALVQVGTVRDAVEREARNTRGKFDEVVLERRRSDALARLGEAIYDLACDGALGDLEDHPAIQAALREVDDATSRLSEAEERRKHGGEGEEESSTAVAAAEWAVNAVRSRFDRSGGASEGTRRGGWPRRADERDAGDLEDHEEEDREEEDRGEPRAWRPGAVRTDRPTAAMDVDDDGTVSALGRGRSATGSGARRDPADRRGAGAPAAEAARPKSWRPPASPEIERRANADETTVVRRARPTPPRPGGIAFVEDEPGSDEDLDSYMHEDDVPKK